MKTHLFKKRLDNGEVIPICRNIAINWVYSTWTKNPKEVTCPDCLYILNLEAQRDADQKAWEE